MTDTFCLVALNSQYVHTNLAVRLIKNLDTIGNTIVLEHTINNQMDMVLESIAKQNPKCVIFSCYIWNIEYVMPLAGSLKKILPNTYIVLAGPEVSYDYEEIIGDNQSIDIVCYGIGEVTYPQLQVGIMQNNLDSVEGICYRENAKTITNPITSTYDINAQPFPYYDIDKVANRILYFETSRGCPFNCSYCMSSISKGVELMSLDKIAESFEIFFRHNAKQVKLVDRTFNYPIDRAISIIEIMLALKNKYPNTRTSFHCELNPLLINMELVDVLKKAPKGFLQFEIGIQSTNPKTLQAIKRDVNLDKQHRNVTMLTALQNITVYVDLIVGLPYETLDIFANSFNDVYNMSPSGLHLGFLKVLKGSSINRCTKEYGIVHQGFAPYKILKSNHISFDEICHLEKIDDLVDTYYNSGNFTGVIKYAVGIFASPYDFYNELCKHLLPQDYFSKAHKFVHHYDALCSFLSTIDDLDLDYARALLLHDYASNSKPRVYPACIANLYTENTKKKAREFYNTPANIEKYLPSYAKVSPSTITRQCSIQIYNYDVTNPSKTIKHTIVLYEYISEIKIQVIK